MTGYFDDLAAALGPSRGDRGGARKDRAGARDGDRRAALRAVRVAAPSRLKFSCAAVLERSQMTRGRGRSTRRTPPTASHMDPFLRPRLKPLLRLCCG